MPKTSYVKNILSEVIEETADKAHTENFTVERFGEVARIKSYATEIASADLQNKILVITPGTWSKTTGRQLKATREFFAERGWSIRN